MSMLSYKILAMLLYPRDSSPLSSVQATSWQGRTFYLTQLSRKCQSTNPRVRQHLEYLKQAGLILSIEHHKEPGRYGKYWTAVNLKMPTEGQT